jgi:hypothetical protein
MNKVLPGSSREAFDFIVSHWRGLLNISILPLIIITAVAWYQISGMAPMFEFLAAQDMQHGQMDSAELYSRMSSMGPFYAVGLISLAAFVWLFVRIVRFWKSGEGSMFAITEGEVGATFKTIGYGVGMMLLTLLVYIGGIIGFAVLAMIGAAIFSNSALVGIGIFLFVIAGALALIALLVFMYRFLVGLPGVALGESPGFFSDIWPLSKGESFGLPLRIVIWTVVGLIPIMIFAFAITIPLSADIQIQLKGQNPPHMTPEMVSHFFKVMAPLQVINMALQVPMIWFMTVLLTVAHFRFRKKLSG